MFPSELLNRNDKDENGQSRREPIRHKRDQHGESSRRERTDDRDESAEESDNGQRARERHTDSKETEADKEGVNKADDRLGADEAAECLPAPGKDFREMPAHTAAGDTTHQRQETLTILEKEERENQHRHHGDHRGGGGRSSREGRLCDGAGLPLNPVGRGVNKVVELFVLDIEGRPREPIEDRLDTLRSLIHQIARLARDAGSNRPNDAAKNQEESEDRGEHRQCGWELPAPQASGHRPENRADNERQNNRQHRTPNEGSALPDHPRCCGHHDKT